MRWRGRWGDTRAALGGLQQSSPTGPGAKPHWTAPERLSRRGPRADAPRRARGPEVDVARQDGMLRLDFDFSKRPGPRRWRSS